MKTKCITRIVAVAIVLSASIARPADEMPAARPFGESEALDRMCRVDEEIRRRRAQRAALMEKMDSSADRSMPRSNWPKGGAVYQPRPLKDEGEPISFSISDLPLDTAISFYACLVVKEVMVSASIADKKLTVSADKLSRAEAVRAYENALTEIGVRIVAVDQDTVVLLEVEKP